MSDIALGPALPAMSDDALAKVRTLETALLAAPQTDLSTDHLLHAGMYARTICIPAGTALTGALIKRATVLIVNGHATVYTGDGTLELAGHHVLPASAGRKQAFIAHADTWLTMIFPTQAVTVEEAEAEFTDEADRLLSRAGVNTIRITGE